MRKASLVVGPDGVRCIYEIQGSGQKFVVQYPFIKTTVNVFPVSNADLRKSFEKLSILDDGEVSNKGIRIIAGKMSEELKKVEGTSDKMKLEKMGYIVNRGSATNLTVNGLKVLASKMVEELAEVEGGDIAVNECDESGTLLKVVK